MMLRCLTFLILLLSLALVACATSDRGSDIPDSNTGEHGLDIHTTQNSVDWNGIYTGVLPCADCPGIRTRITLNTDNTYMRQQEYIDRPERFTDRGIIFWDQSGQVITLDSDSGSDARYWVTENRIVKLDRQGNRIEGGLADHYILHKQLAQ